MKPPCGNPLIPLSSLLVQSPHPRIWYQSGPLSSTPSPLRSFILSLSPFPSFSLSSPSANAIASVHVRATSYKSWFTFVPGSGASRNTRTNRIHPVVRMHGRNPIRRNHTRFHDIIDDRIVNGVTQDPELSSEATTCVVCRGGRQIQWNRMWRIGIKGSIEQRVFACQKSISDTYTIARSEKMSDT